MRNLLLASVFVFGVTASHIALAQSEIVSVTEAPVAAAPAAPASPDAAVPAAAPQNAAVAPMADGTTVAALPAANAPAAPMTTIEKEISEQLSFLKPNVNINLMNSLFFTKWEHDLVIDARRGLITRTPGTDDGVTPDAGPRDVSLAGIVFHNKKEWTIWLNNMRVSPTRIPDEVMDLKVFKDYIELEWFDASTNQIFPIRLRAHQRFNLDARMFLPG